jgi:hypothetical protein
MVDIPTNIGAWWPLIFFVIAITHVAEGKPGGAVTMFLLGAWFMAVTWDWMGLTYRNSWSLALIAIGSGMVVKALSGEDQPRKRPKGESS